MKIIFSLLLLAAALFQQASGYAFVTNTKRSILSVPSRPPLVLHQNRYPHQRHHGRTSAMQMIDDNVIMGAGIAIAGLAAGIGLVAFTEAQGERAKARGSGLSENMQTRIAGALLEDVEVSTVSDLGSLTSQLEKALKETGAASEEALVMSEEDKRRITNEADDGW